MNGAIKWHGGKHYLASKFIKLMPSHTHYVEPYAGGLSVLLAKPPMNVSEVVNDTNYELMNFWEVLRGPRFNEFVRLAQATPFSQPLYEKAVAETHLLTDSVDLAFNFFVRCRMSLAGRMKSFAPLSKNRTRRGMNEQAAAWLTAVDGLTDVHTRMKSVVVLNKKAIDVIKSEDSANTFFYLDPPYLHETRVSVDVYGPHEMSVNDHEELLKTLSSINGKFMLSGYDSDLYRTYESNHNWHRHCFNVPNNASLDVIKSRKIEIVWTNYDLQPIISNGSLF